MLSAVLTLSTNLKRALLGERLLGKLATELTTFLSNLGLYQLGRKQVFIDAATALVAADNGKTLIISGSGSIAITLPVATNLVGPYFLFNIANQDVVITAPASNDSLITDGDAGADTVTFSTASHKIGACAAIFVVDTTGAGTTFKWAVVPLGLNAVTIA